MLKQKYPAIEIAEFTRTQRKIRRLKSRLQKQSPPTRTNYPTIKTMSENEEFTPSENDKSAADLSEDSTQVDAEELVEVIAEFERYRERLVSETIAAAQKAKLPQKPALAKIEPELAKIEAGLESLRTQLAAITTNN